MEKEAVESMLEGFFRANPGHDETRKREYAKYFINGFGGKTLTDLNTLLSVDRNLNTPADVIQLGNLLLIFLIEQKQVV